MEVSQSELELLRDNFMSRVLPEPNSGCWLWIGSITTYGYGSFMGRQAHQVSLAIEGVCIPSDREPDHTCRVRSCVNPKHLEIVTSRINNLRSPISTSSIYSRMKTCKLGHPLSGDNLGFREDRKSRYCKACKSQIDASYRPRQTPSRKRHVRPTKSELDEMKSLYLSGITQKAIATMFNITSGGICLIVKRGFSTARTDGERRYADYVNQLEDEKLRSELLK